MDDIEYEDRFVMSSLTFKPTPVEKCRWYSDHLMVIIDQTESFSGCIVGFRIASGLVFSQIR